MSIARRDLPDGLGKSTPRFNDILALVSRGARVSVSEITGKRRTGNIVEARHIVMHLAATMTLMSYAEIGQMLGGREHSTVHRGAQSLCALMRRERSVADRVERYKQHLRKTAADRWASGSTGDGEVA